MADLPHLMLTPGPVAVAPETWDAIARPALHQRSAAFESFFAAMQAGLQYLFQTEQPVLSLAGSGTLGMEITMRSIFSSGDKVAVQENGKFSQRWRTFAQEAGWDLVPLTAKWGEVPSLADVEAILEEHPDLKGWVLTHVETSTGMAIDLEEIAFAIREAQPGQLIVVDGICSVGIQALYFDDWGLDAVVAASQKGLANPAGTSFVALSARAVAALSPADPGNALHLHAYHDFLLRGSYPFTPPGQLFFGVKARLDALQAQGLPGHWQAIHARKRRFDRAVCALGAEIAGPQCGQGLSVIRFAGRDHVALQAQLKNDFGIEVANGQGALRGKILRIGHFGAIGGADTQACSDALAQILQTEKA